MAAMKLPRSNIAELPTCPVCLAVLDGRGLLEIKSHGQCAKCGYVAAPCCEGKPTREKFSYE